MTFRSSLVTVAVLIAVAAGVAIPLPGSRPAVIQDNAECNCQLTQSGVSYGPTPACYNSTVFSVQNMVSGICAGSGCPAAFDCSYSISITVLANAGMSCDFAIYMLTAPFGSVNQVASCTSCTQLNYSPATDPVTVQCDTVYTYEDRWSVSVCNAGSAPPTGCPYSSIAALTVLRCNVCNLP